MISTNELITEVKFGKNGKGTIALISKNKMDENHGLLVLQMLTNQDINIGERPKAEDIQELPRIELNFYDKKSVDAMIENLKKVKEFMDYPYGIQCYAC